MLAERHGPVPVVAAVAGFVTVGAAIVDVRPAARSTARTPVYDLALGQPGPRLATFHERRLATGPGPDWLLLDVRGRDV